MTPAQRTWAQARSRLADTVVSLGYPAEFADLLAAQLGSPRAISRMTSWLMQANPGSMEMIVDEMLAIREETDAWRRKKESQEAQAGCSAWLRSEARRKNLEDEDAKE